MSLDWIAVDWGTSNLRAWGIGADGAVLEEASSETGMGRLTEHEFAPTLRDLVSGWELPARVPVVACGMVGARGGWAEAPYRPLQRPPQLQVGRRRRCPPLAAAACHWPT